MARTGGGGAQRQRRRIQGQRVRGELGRLEAALSYASPFRPSPAHPAAQTRKRDALEEKELAGEDVASRPTGAARSPTGPEVCDALKFVWILGFPVSECAHPRGRRAYQFSRRCRPFQETCMFEVIWYAARPLSLLLRSNPLPRTCSFCEVEAQI